MAMTYLDHAATTPMLPVAVARYTEALGRVGNPSSLHTAGRRARRRRRGGPREHRRSRSAPCPTEVVPRHRRAPRPTTSRSRASSGPAGPPTRAAPASWSSAVEHHAVLDAAEWLAEHEGATLHVLPSTRPAGSHPPTLRAVLAAARRRDRRGQRDVGQQRGRHRQRRPRARRGRRTSSTCRCTPTRCRPSAPLPVDFAASGADALSLTGHKLGGPVGVGALLLRRDAVCVPLLHGGGQERDVRSGTLDVAGTVALAAAVRAAVDDAPRRAVELAALRDDLVARLVAEVPDATLNGVPLDAAPVGGGPARLPGNAHLSFPGCEGDSLLMLLDAHEHRVLDRLGLHRRGGPALARAAGDGRRRGGRPRLAALLARPQLDRGRRRRRRGASAGRRSGPRAPGARAPARAALAALVRVLAAMSGGVDSAVAAARAVDAGHDVVGVHLALSAQARDAARGRPRVLHGRGRPRRPPRRRRARHPVLRLGLRRRGSREDVVDDFVAEYAAGPHPQPVPALQREDQVRGAARPGARARLRRRRHRPLRARSSGRRRCAAPPTRTRTSPTCSAC